MAAVSAAIEKAGFSNMVLHGQTPLGERGRPAPSAGRWRPAFCGGGDAGRPRQGVRSATMA